MRCVKRYLAPGVFALAVHTSALLAQDYVMPASLRKVEAHKIVRRVVARRVELGLSATQVALLNALQIEVRNAPHRFVRVDHDHGKPPTMTHRPTITQEQAFADAMALLSSDQRGLAVTLLGQVTHRRRAASATRVEQSRNPLLHR